MAVHSRFSRRGWRFGAAGLLAMMPACSALDTQPPALPVPSSPVSTADAGPIAILPPVILAADEVKKGADSKPATTSTSLPPTAAAAVQGKPLPINLPTALALSGASPVEIQIAGERLEAAAAQLEQARVLWLPTVTFGFDYNWHNGRIQNVDGTVIDTTRSSFMFGGGTGIGNAAILNVNDAIFAPLAARQFVRAREADWQAVHNDTLAQVADAYFTVQQARGEVAGSLEALRRAEELVRLTAKLVPDFTPSVEINRAKAEAARRRQAVETARERWDVVSADLVRLLRLDPTAKIEPVEPPELRVELIDPRPTIDELIPLALSNRPELASRQAEVQATLALLRQERLRPLIPSVLIRGWSTPVTGTLGAGVFAGGTNGTLGDRGFRADIDGQLLWQFDNLLFGNRARTHQREAENRQAIIELFRVQDQVAADVVQAHSRLQRSANRLKAAEEEVVNAAETADKNLKGLVPGKRIGEQLVLVFRPQEAVAAVTALDQAYRDYYAAVADHNRAQYQLYRALGHPAQCLAVATNPVTTLPATIIPAPRPLTDGMTPSPSP